MFLDKEAIEAAFESRVLNGVMCEDAASRAICLDLKVSRFPNPGKQLKDPYSQRYPPLYNLIIIHQRLAQSTLQRSPDKSRLRNVFFAQNATLPRAPLVYITVVRLLLSMWPCTHQCPKRCGLKARSTDLTGGSNLQKRQATCSIFPVLPQSMIRTVVSFHPIGNGAVPTSAL